MLYVYDYLLEERVVERSRTAKGTSLYIWPILPSDFSLNKRVFFDKRIADRNNAEQLSILRQLHLLFLFALPSHEPVCLVQMDAL